MESRKVVLKIYLYGSKRDRRFEHSWGKRGWDNMRI